MTTILRSFAALMLAAVASIAVADGGCPAFGAGEVMFQQQTDEQSDGQPGKLKQLVEELEEEDEDEEPDCE